MRRGPTLGAHHLSQLRNESLSGGNRLPAHNDMLRRAHGRSQPGTTNTPALPGTAWAYGRHGPARSGMPKGATDPSRCLEPGWQSAPPGYPSAHPGPGLLDPFAPYGRHPVTGQPFFPTNRRLLPGLLQLLDRVPASPGSGKHLGYRPGHLRSCWWAG